MSLVTTVTKWLGAVMRSEPVPADDKAPPPIVAPAPPPTLARTSPTTAGKHDRDAHYVAVEGDADMVVMFGKPAPIEEPDDEHELRAHLDGYRRTEAVPLHLWKGKVV